MSLFDYLPGRELAVFEIAEDHALQIGTFLGTMHVACRDMTRRRANRFGLKTLYELLSRCRDAAHPEQLPDLDLLSGVLDGHQIRNSLPQGIVHGDLFIDNARFERGKLCGVIDFEMASAGPLCYDLSVAICDWAFDQDTFHPKRARAILEGYTGHRRLTVVEERVLFAYCCYAAARFAITRFYDFEVNANSDVQRLYKDYRHFMGRLRSLQAYGEEAFGANVIPH